MDKKDEKNHDEINRNDNNDNEESDSGSPKCKCRCKHFLTLDKNELIPENDMSKSIQHVRISERNKKRALPIGVEVN